MTDFSKTINNSIRTFGIGPASEWGDMVWGDDNWGEGSIEVQTQKWINVGISNSLGVTSEVTRYVQKFFSNSIGSDSTIIRIPTRVLANSIGSTSELYRGATKCFDVPVPVDTDNMKALTRIWNDAVSCVADMGSEKIYDRDGYVRNFPGSKQDGEDRIFDQWTQTSDAVDSATETTDAATVWSEA